MRKTILLSAFLLLGVVLFGQTTFHKRFQDGIILGITPLGNGGILGTGFHSQFFAPNEGLLVRFNDLGEPIWRKRYPALNFIRFSIETSDGFLIVGDTVKTTGTHYSVLSKLSFSGDVLWSKIIGNALEVASPYRVISTPNGPLISGQHDDTELGSQSGVFFTNIDEIGNVLWSKTYYSTNPNYNGGFSAQLVQGDTLYACGHIQGNGCFVRVNLQTGELIGWSSFGGIYREEFNSVQATQDGNFILAGLTRSTTGSEEERPWVVKVDRHGQIIWSKTYNISGVSLGSRLVNAGDRGFILSMGQEEGLFNFYSVLAKIDESGDLLWAYNYSNGQNSGLDEIKQTTDGGFVTLGAGMLKVDKFGRVANGCCPAPITFQVEDYMPPYQNPVMIAEDWGVTTPFSMVSVADSSFSVSDYCDVAITSIVEQVLVCQGDSIEINGAFYQAPNTIRDTVLNLEGGCDTVRVYNLVQIPQPFRVETILFCPGDTAFVDGIAYFYPGVLPNPDTLRSTGSGCDTLLYQVLAYPSVPSTVQALCPPDITVTTAPATPIPVLYTMPSGTSDCTCPDLYSTLVQGVPSGGLFPVGLTQVCYALSDICGAVETCCFEVNVVEEQVCDVKETPCIRYELLDISIDAEQNKTYRIRLTNHCVSPLVSASMQLPNGLNAIAPVQNSLYISSNNQEYTVRNPNFSPFRSVRFKAIQAGIANGQADVFEYTLPAQAAPVFIRLSTRLASGATYETTLNTFECVIQAERSAMNQGVEPSSTRVFQIPVAVSFLSSFLIWNKGLFKYNYKMFRDSNWAKLIWQRAPGHNHLRFQGSCPMGYTSCN
jgi:hypothetical protein